MLSLSLIFTNSIKWQQLYKSIIDKSQQQLKIHLRSFISKGSSAMHCQYGNLTKKPIQDRRKPNQRYNPNDEESSSQDFYECTYCGQNIAKQEIHDHIKKNHSKKRRKEPVAKKALTHNKFWGWRCIAPINKNKKKETVSNPKTEKAPPKTKKIQKANKKDLKKKQAEEVVEENQEDVKKDPTIAKIERGERVRARNRQKNQVRRNPLKNATLRRPIVKKKEEPREQSQEERENLVDNQILPLPRRSRNLPTIKEVTNEDIANPQKFKFPPSRYTQKNPPKLQQMLELMEEDDYSDSNTESYSSSQSEQVQNKSKKQPKKSKPITKKIHNQMMQKIRYLKGLRRRYKAFIDITLQELSNIRLELERGVQRSREERRQNNEGQQSMATEDQRQAKLEDNPISPIKANHPQDTNPLEERRRLLRERLQRSSEKKRIQLTKEFFAQRLAKYCKQ